MDIVLAAFLAVLPLILLILGILEDRALFTLIGSIGLIVLGVLYLASPPSVYYISAQHITKGVVNNTTAYENITYTYATRPLSDNSNLFISVLFSFFGLAGLYNIAWALAHGEVGED